MPDRDGTRLLIGVPSAGSPTAPFLAALGELRLPQTAATVESITVQGNFVPGQRELIARQALERGADHLLMIDDDMIVPPDALIRLAEVLDADPACGLCGALYYSRDGLRPMAVGGWSSTQTAAGWIPAFRDDAATRVDGVGFGCVLLRVAALRDLAAPFFGAQIYVERRAGRVRLCNEDYLFCERLRGAGHGVKLHGGVRCGHFDRASGRVEPERWETNEETDRRRMVVVEPGPRFRVAPFSADVPTVSELREPVAVEYLVVE